MRLTYCMCVLYMEGRRVNRWQTEEGCNFTGQDSVMNVWKCECKCWMGGDQGRPGSGDLHWMNTGICKHVENVCACLRVCTDPHCVSF